MRTITKLNTYKFFNYFLFLFSLLYSLSFITWSLWDDGYYFYNHFGEYNNDVMIPFYLYVGNVYTRYVSQDMLWVNFLAWLLCFSSISIVYLGWTERNDWSKKLHFFSVGIIFLGYGTFGEYSPDTLTLFFLVLSCFILYKRPIEGFQTILVVSLLSAFLIASRFSNVVFLPLVIFYIGVKSYFLGLRKLKIFYLLILYLTLSTSLYWMLMYILTGRTDLINAIYKSFTIPVTSYNTHEIQNLIRVYYEDFYASFKFLTCCVGAIGIPHLFGLRHHNARIYQMLAWLPLLILLCLERQSLLGPMFGWKSLSGFLTIFVMACISIKKRQEPIYIIHCLLFMAAGLVMAAGSDTGFLKIGVFFATISPVVLIEYEHQYKFNFYSAGILVIAALFVFFCHEKHFMQVCSPIETTHYERSTQIVSLQKKLELEEHIANANKYGIKDHSIYCGTSGFRVQAIMGSKLIYHCSFWQIANDEIETDNIIRVMKSDSLCTVFDYNNSSMLKRKMEDIGMRCVLQTKNEAIYKH